MDFTEQGITINSEMYCETLEKLQRAIQNKQCGTFAKHYTTIHYQVYLNLIKTIQVINVLSPTILCGFGT